MSRAEDVLVLAEAVADGARTLAEAERVLPDEAARAELRALVRALAAVRAHATASAMPERGPASAAALEVAATRVRPGAPRRSPGFALGGAFAVLAIVVVGAIAALSVRPGPSVGGPSPAATPTLGPTPNVASAIPSPLAPPSQGPVGAPGLPPLVPDAVAGPDLAFWSYLTPPDRLATWIWDPKTVRFVEHLELETWPGPDIARTVLFAPNGAHLAIHEVNVTTSSPVQRVRIVDYDGTLVWEAASGDLPLVTAMAWSPDGTALAIGSLPSPWTVVQLSETGAEPDVTTYELPMGDGYQLLGFSVDGNRLYGFGTGGEAEFWQKPVLLERSRGLLAPIEAFPAGPTGLSTANATGPVAQFDALGRVLAIAGAPKGDPHWVVRAGEAETPVAVDASAALAWGPGGEIVALAAVDGGGFILTTYPVTGEGRPTPAVTLPSGPYRADLIGARDGFALLTLASSGDDTPAREALLVELATGRIAVGLPPVAAGDDAGFTFAGWLGQRD
jgi:hypothetical protein